MVEQDTILRKLTNGTHRSIDKTAPWCRITMLLLTIEDGVKTNMGEIKESRKRS